MSRSRESGVALVSQSPSSDAVGIARRQPNQCFENSLFGDYVLRLRPFLSLRHFHGYLLPFLEGFKTFHLYRRVVHENILPTIALDETKTLVVIEPLDGSRNSFA